MSLVNHSNSIRACNNTIAHNNKVAKNTAISTFTKCYTTRTIFKSIVAISIEIRFIGNNFRINLCAAIKIVIGDNIETI